jgi:hypothetical protein
MHDEVSMINEKYESDIHLLTPLIPSPTFHPQSYSNTGNPNNCGLPSPNSGSIHPAPGYNIPDKLDKYTKFCNTKIQFKCSSWRVGGEDGRRMKRV